MFSIRLAFGRSFLLLFLYSANLVAAQNSNSNVVDLRLTPEEKMWLVNHKEFSIGIDKHWYPYEFVDEHGMHVGIAADYLKFAAFLLDIQFKTVETNNWGEAYQNYKLGEIDILPAIIETEDRLNDTLFTHPYFTTPTVIVSRKNAFYADSIQALEGKKLALVRGFAIVELVRKNNPEINLVLVDSIKAGLYELEQGNVDGYIGAIAGINSEINKGSFKQLIISAFTPYDLRVSMAVSDEQAPLVSILNKVFASMDNRQRAEISNAWLSVHVKQGVSLSTILIWGLPPFMLLSFVVAFIVKLNRGLKEEVKRRRKVEKRLKHLAQHDNLTGLPNRLLFKDLAHFSLAKAKRENEKHAVLFVDIDGFKAVNDQYGHHIGDELLKSIAKRLNQCVRESDIVARQGGDEFLVLLNDNVDIELVQVVAKKLVSDLARVYLLSIDGQPVTKITDIGASIGVAIYPDNSAQLDELIKLADAAMYQAKSAGKNSFVLSK